MNQNRKVTAEEVEHLADLTSVARILNYLAADDAITTVIQVKDPELTIAQVAAATANFDEKMVDWVFQGKIFMHSPATWAVQNMFGKTDHVLDPKDACHCIRVEPAYVIKLTGGKYE